MMFYANINSSYTGVGHPGTQENPFSWEDLYNRLNGWGDPDDDYFILGSKTLPSGDVSFIEFRSMDSWDPYNPWILYKSDGFAITIEAGTSASIKNGRLHISGGINSRNISFYSSFIEFGTELRLYNSRLFGCALHGTEISNISGGTSLLIKDSALSTAFNNFGGGHTTTFDHSVMTDVMASIGTIIDSGGNQESWNTSGIVWPNQDSEKGEFNFLRFSFNITTVGSGNYYGYENGLFGNPRTFLGGFYFALPFYVDLDRAINGYGDEMHPFCARQFIERIAGDVPDNYVDEYKVKGDIELIPQHLGIMSVFKISNWTKDPWRISVSSGMIESQNPNWPVYIEGGIIKISSHIFLGKVRAKNIFLDTNIAELSKEISELRGCTIIIRNKIISYIVSNELWLYDCIARLKSMGSPNGLLRLRTSSIDIAAYQLGSWSDALTDNGSNQLNASQLQSIRWPSWNAAKPAFNYDNLVGSFIWVTGSSFIGYDKGLFGEPRKGIGALFFPPDVTGSYHGLLEVGQNWNVRIAGNTFVTNIKEEAESSSSPEV